MNLNTSSGAGAWSILGQLPSPAHDPSEIEPTSTSNAFLAQVRFPKIVVADVTTDRNLLAANQAHDHVTQVCSARRRVWSGLVRVETSSLICSEQQENQLAGSDKEVC